MQANPITTEALRQFEAIFKDWVCNFRWLSCLTGDSFYPKKFELMSRFLFKSTFLLPIDPSLIARSCFPIYE